MEVLSSQVVSSLESLFLWLSLPTARQIQKINKDFSSEVGTMYNRGWNWDTQVRATSIDRQVQTVTARELTWPVAESTGPAQQTPLDAKCLLVCNSESKIRLVMSPKIKKYASISTPHYHLGVQNMQRWSSDLPRVTAEGRVKPWPIHTSCCFYSPCLDCSASFPAGYSYVKAALWKIYISLDGNPE